MTRAVAKDATGRFLGSVAVRTCYFCGVDISDRRKDAWACAEHAGPRAWHLRRRREGQLARRLSRPRCMICSKPLDPKLKGSTCSRECAVKRWNWFRRGSIAA